jgi:hypothetical protein
VFDCVLIRFLSPDPFIQEPYTTQNLNRYTYGLNNPFKYNDPSGYFFKKIAKVFTNPKVLLAVALSVATGFVLAPIAAGIAASAVALTGVTAGGVAAGVMTGAITGAVIGAGTGFTSSLVMSNGNLNAALQGSLNGAIAGTLSGGFGGGFSDKFAAFAGETVGKGSYNLMKKENFFKGFESAATSFASQNLYKYIVGYKVDPAPGGPAAPKGPNDRPVEGANNVGFQGNKGYSKFNEGEALSNAFNKIPGINAIAGMHDLFQINLPDKFFIRDHILNIPGMPVAAVMTYSALYNTIQCPMC